MSVKQVDAVVNAVQRVLGDDFEPKKTDANELLTKSQKQQVSDIVAVGIINGEVKFNKSTDDRKEVERYARGMVDNHLRKSSKLNGGVPYRPSSSGTKRDPQLKELNKLLSTLSPDTDEYQTVKKHIDERKEQLRSNKPAAKSDASSKIDTDSLPANLRGIAGVE